MRILYLHQYFNTPHMSGGTRSYEFAKRLVNRGHDVCMITSRRERGLERDVGWTETHEDGIRVRWFSVPYSNRMNHVQRMNAFARYAWVSSIAASRTEADVVFATSTPLTVAIPAICCSWRQQIPMVFEVRDLWPEAPIAAGVLRNPMLIGAARFLERAAYQHSTRIVALSPGMKEGIVATGYPADRISVIPNASDTELFGQQCTAASELRKEHAWLENRPMVLYAGALGAVNGVEYLVELAAAVGDIDPEIRFVIIGDGREISGIREAAAHVNVLDRNLFMLPSLPKMEVAPWVAAATIATSLVINRSPLWKNSANKFFDALAAGVPVAINYGGWQADVIRESGAGLVLDPCDTRRAAHSLLQALRDDEWLDRARSAAKRLAVERYDRDMLSEQLEQVLIDALAESRLKNDRWHHE